MNECIINPSQNRGEPDLPPLGLLAVNPSDTSSFPEIAKEYQLERHFLFNSKLFSSPSFFIAGPALGAPMAAICLEKLIALGARNIIIYGWCGAISPSLSAGDIFIPVAGVSGEGTSKYYQQKSGFEPDKGLCADLIGFLEQQEYGYKQGIIWTTDALYRETKKEIELLKNQGVAAIDMEYTGLTSVAKYREVALSAIMMVSDELYHGRWNQKITSKKFRLESKKIFRALCDHCHKN